MGRLLYRKAFEPFQQEFADKLNGILQTNHSQWYFSEFKVYTQDTFLQISLSFYTIDNIWCSRLYMVDYEGNILNTQEITLTDKSYPFQDDFFVNFNPDPYFHDFLDTVVIETRKKRTACIVSNKIRKELAAAVWHPTRVAKLIEAGIAIETL